MGLGQDKGVCGRLLGAREMVWAMPEKIKASVTVLEFVSQYVDLKLTTSGAIGLCPFHDDHHPNFGVDKEGVRSHQYHHGVG